MKNTVLITLTLIITLSIIVGCSQNSTPEGPVLVTVGKSAITEKDFMTQVSRVPDWAREQFKGKEGKERFLEEMIKRDLIYNQAKKMRLQNDKEYIEKLKEFEKMTLVALLLKKEIEDKVQVTEDEARALFDENQDKFTIGTQLRASHILVETEDEAKNIHDRITKGEDFAKLAKELSKDQGSAAKGGDLGYFGRGRMVPEFERAAMSLKPGEVSSPVRSRFGYHIIKLTDIKKGDQASFDQSKAAIQKQLQGQKQKALLDTFIEKLRAESKITKNEELIEAISLPWEQAEAPATEAQPSDQTKAE
ncbi:MAG: peptidylprolyl isomerase [Nitrospiraceae bacterium]|nr:MAG: peptidylprolyl isomerase [Nitrospiraceae bacterium]